MSIPVDVDDIAVAAADYPQAYLLTVGDELKAKVADVVVDWHGSTLCVAVGPGSVRNVTQRPAATVVFAPATAEGYSLLVDGTATLDDCEFSDGTPRVHLAPSSAVKHRRAAAT